LESLHHQAIPVIATSIYSMATSPRIHRG
jgi:hypothetical protein